MSTIREGLRAPYWAQPYPMYWAQPNPQFPCFDFNKEIVPPGVVDDFPDGAIGVRIDDGFLAVAALPYSYIGWTIQEIVADLWPKAVGKARYGPDTYARQEVEAKE